MTTLFDRNLIWSKERGTLLISRRDAGGTLNGAKKKMGIGEIEILRFAQNDILRISFDEEKKGKS